MSYSQKVEDHHKLTYSDNVQSVAQQRKNRLRPAVTIMNGLTGEAHSVADLLGKKKYIRGSTYDRSNPRNRADRSRRWLVRPEVIHDGDIIDKADKFDMAMDPTSHLVRDSVITVERGVFDTILGIEETNTGFKIANSGIMGVATEGKRGTSTTPLPTGNFIAYNYGSGGNGLSLDKLRKVKLDLNQAEFGMEDDDPFYAAITPKQVDDLIGIAAATNQSLNAFAVEQLRSGKPTELMGFTWIATNRLPTDSNGYRLCPVWSKRNIVCGFWQDVEGQIWNDTSQQNLPYYYTSVFVDCVRVEDGGVRVIRCSES
ncbi:phage capsid protein [Roseovarius indicus]|uniref:Capsid protein n=1 Tax=Roseovarius indicus TaxID=540747 RepID=A0A0T5P3B6_9RHOB|nr:phage capsid protein [Roseovarius indicus]KRS15658.1 hypothetical protein XM52_22735 [Roseovarius indicus]QEW27831.1 hypothetical protein RIdsm_03651 [Roseovarius indicus]SFE79677.1 hypothetical protein SAMN04488031_12237 [Roseovarius indicus]